MPVLDLYQTAIIDTQDGISEVMQAGCTMERTTLSSMPLLSHHDLHGVPETMQVGYTMGWTTLSSMLSSLKERFGPAVLLQLNLAFFLPSLPILLMQTRLDARFDRKYGLPQATAVRMVVGTYPPPSML